MTVSIDISTTATHALTITEQIRDDTNGILKLRLLYEANHKFLQGRINRYISYHDPRTHDN